MRVCCLQADLAVELLSAGLARLPQLKRVRDPAVREMVTALGQYEEEAKQARRGVFTYGDPGTCKSLSATRTCGPLLESAYS